MSPARRLVRFVLRTGLLVHAVAAVPILVLAVLLLACATTAGGRLFAAGMILLQAVPGLLYAWLRARR